MLASADEMTEKHTFSSNNFADESSKFGFLIDDFISSILHPRDTISAGFCAEGTYLQIASDVFSCISDTRLLTNVCNADG